MKKAFFVCIISMLIIHTNSFAAFTESKKAEKESYGAFKSAEQKAAAEFFVSLSRKQYEQLTGKHLSLTERLAFKMAQKHVKHEIIATKQTYGFNIGGFIMGLLLSVVGVVLAYLFSSDTNVRTWAWVGALVNVLLLILIL
jgi:hypothetical protein